MLALSETVAAGTTRATIHQQNGTVIHTGPGETVTSTQNGTVIVTSPGNGSNGSSPVTVTETTIHQAPLSGPVNVNNGDENHSTNGGFVPTQHSPDSNNISNSHDNSGTGNGSTTSPSITIPVPNSIVPPNLTSPTVVHHRG